MAVIDPALYVSAKYSKLPATLSQPWTLFFWRSGLDFFLRQAVSSSSLVCTVSTLSPLCVFDGASGVGNPYGLTREKKIGTEFHNFFFVKIILRLSAEVQ